MSFWKSLFGGGAPRHEDGGVLAQDSYKGFAIRATEMRVGSEYQLAGTIEKTIGEQLRQHDFIRADRLSSPEEAGRMALAKARQIIDEQGDSLFS